jgi:hypothetical protein
MYIYYHQNRKHYIGFPIFLFLQQHYSFVIFPFLLIFLLNLIYKGTNKNAYGTSFFFTFFNFLGGGENDKHNNKNKNHHPE